MGNNDYNDMFPQSDIVQFAQLRDGAIIPSKRDDDAGYDIYACFDEDYMVIYPHETKMIPTGLISAFNKKYVGILKERGSTGSKGIAQRCGIIDSSYRGEWFVALTNTTNHNIFIKKKDKEITKTLVTDEDIIYPYEKAVCQCIFVEVPHLFVVKSAKEDILALESERGTGKIGSSGK